MWRPFLISTGAWKYTERESRAECEQQKVRAYVREEGKRKVRGRKGREKLK
jgi:hypothetical protein